jgi:hypothetical protein
MDQEYEDYDDPGLRCRASEWLRSDLTVLAVVTVGPLVIMSALLVLTYWSNK